jgi:uncharacterized protein (TIGR02646 family)
MVDLLKVHRQLPVRREVAAQTRYRLYRNDLRQDFVGACGYCGDDDGRADPSTFHIDHFAPKKLFPDFELTYENLVYACRFCNVSKSDHWIGNDPKVPHNGSQGFVDPCSDDFDVHLGRDADGRIVAKTGLGSYIVRRLKLSLIRHELLWRARKARALQEDVDILIEKFNESGKALPEYVTLLQSYRELQKLINDYELRAIPR